MRFHGFKNNHGGKLAVSREQPSHLPNDLPPVVHLFELPCHAAIAPLRAAMSLHLGDTDKSTKEELQFEYLKNWISSVHNRKVAENVTCPFNSLALGISAQGDSRILVQHALVLQFASVVV